MSLLNSWPPSWPHTLVHALLCMCWFTKIVGPHAWKLPPPTFQMLEPPLTALEKQT